MLNFVFSYTTFLPKIMFLAPSLAFMAVYVWGRRSTVLHSRLPFFDSETPDPNSRMSFLGLFTFNAPYLPWVILGFGLLLGQNPVFDLLGILIGHIYFYLEDVLPVYIGRRVLVTPTVVYVSACIT